MHLPFYFPTTTLLLDDNKEFLNSLYLKLSQTEAVTIAQHSQDAFELIKNSFSVSHIVNNCFTNKGEQFNEEDENIHVNLGSIHEQLNNPKRFSIISTLVIDYDMPDMNGLEFCRLLKKEKSSVQILMLTGVATNRIAVDAFNEGIIDKFIIKGSTDTIKEVGLALAALKQKYFEKETAVLKNALILRRTCALTNDAYLELLKHFQINHQIEEYYLLDYVGSYIGFDKNGQSFTLLVKDTHELESYCAIATEHDISRDLVEQLQKKQVMPYFLSEADYQNPPSEWHRFLCSIAPLDTRQHYYYSLNPVIKGKLGLTVNQSFNDYLKEVA